MSLGPQIYNLEWPSSIWKTSRVLIDWFGSLKPGTIDDLADFAGCSFLNMITSTNLETLFLANKQEIKETKEQGNKATKHSERNNQRTTLQRSIPTSIHHLLVSLKSKPTSTSSTNPPSHGFPEVSIDRGSHGGLSWLCRSTSQCKEGSSNGHCIAGLFGPISTADVVLVVLPLVPASETS